MHCLMIAIPVSLPLSAGESTALRSACLRVFQSNSRLKCVWQFLITDAAAAVVATAVFSHRNLRISFSLYPCNALFQIHFVSPLSLSLSRPCVHASACIFAHAFILICGFYSLYLALFDLCERRCAAAAAAFLSPLFALFYRRLAGFIRYQQKFFFPVHAHAEIIR